MGPGGGDIEDALARGHAGPSFRSWTTIRGVGASLFLSGTPRLVPWRTALAQIADRAPDFATIAPLIRVPRPRSVVIPQSARRRDVVGTVSRRQYQRECAQAGCS